MKATLIPLSSCCVQVSPPPRPPSPYLASNYALQAVGSASWMKGCSIIT